MCRLARVGEEKYGVNQIRLKRVYEPPLEADGYRILVDRIWPRGLKKNEARIDLWLRNIAPSEKLRKWFAHEPARFPSFKERYEKELAENSGTVNQLLEVLRTHPVVTLLYAARDPEHNQAVVLRDFVKRVLQSPAQGR